MSSLPTSIILPSTSRKCNSPAISVLPTELLVQIFTLLCSQPPRPSCQHSEEEINNYPSFSTPLFLGKICGSWRDLVWATPSLWRRIDLILPIEKHDIYAELLEEWLGRSKSLPLSITFRRDDSIRAGNVAEWGDKALPLFHLISNEWQRWEHIDLFVPHGFCTLRMEGVQSNDMPLLRTAKLRGLQQRSPGPYFLSNTPNLSTLHFHGSKFPPLSGPYLQLTRLIVSGLCLNDVMHIITHAPNVVTLYVAEGTAPFIARTDQQKVSLARLTSLTMIRSVLLAAFLDALDLPGLAHLHLEGNPVKPLVLDGIYPFIRRHGRSLQSLSLAGFAEARFDEFIESMPALRRFTLKRENGTRNAEFFQFALAVAVGSHLLPQLEYLEFHGTVYPLDVIFWAVQRRWGTLRIQGDLVDRPHRNNVPASKVRSLVLSASLPPKYKEEATTYLKRELAEGLDLGFIDWAFVSF
ncbi:hypothetical protein BDN70DRAFT_872998 [Pholiota conissans]|uniref:F-box domain-containing protein n=1 Tax=Pholiota conissans TaxID=109636 RepID=A0A9P5ZCD1_9AGAR|nr:hypothetical protein BDN70DRAFT_872998 [Pholiota conissans]